MKTLILVILSLFYTLIAFGQDYPDSGIAEAKRLLNNNIKYKITTVSYYDESKPITNYVIVEFNEKLLDAISKWTYPKTMQLLQDEKTDWATNLILYCIYKRKALLLYGSSRDKWIVNVKEEDMKYWKSFLADKKNFQKLSAVTIDNIPKE